MTHGRLKAWYFVLEGINALATSFYGNYLFFYLAKQFQFGSLGNLAVCALNGFVFMLAAWRGGKFAQRHGYHLALRIGFTGMAAGLIVGSLVDTVAAHCAVLAAWTAAMCLTWPTLEALVSEGGTPAGLPRRIGIYNLVWAAGAALSYFAGGAVVDWLGWRAMFWIPAGLHGMQLVILGWLRRNSHHLATAAAPATPPAPPDPEGVPRPVAKAFLHMAWLANPFAYVAINTAIPLIPHLANRLDLTPTYAGFFCSLWMFARFAAFVLLWRWTRWHYRFGWLLAAFVVMILSFGAMLLAPNLWAVAAAQIAFGLAIGLIYYSSLFYSMDVGETKGEHGGFHEALLGAGIFVGPAVGAASLHFFPKVTDVSVWTVSGLLVTGLAILVWMRRRARHSRTRNGKS